MGAGNCERFAGSDEGPGDGVCLGVDGQGRQDFGGSGAEFGDHCRQVVHGGGHGDALFSIFGYVVHNIGAAQWPWWRPPALLFGELSTLATLWKRCITGSWPRRPRRSRCVAGDVLPNL